MDFNQFEGMKHLEVLKRLLADGWTYLGSGCGALVLKKKYARKIVKIVCGDTGQIVACKFFMENSHEQFVKVHEMVKLDGLNSYLITQEKLAPQPNRSLTKHGLTWLNEEARDKLKACAVENDFSFDLHPGNIMLRGYRQWVVVDPFYSGKGHDSVKEMMKITEITEGIVHA